MVVRACSPNYSGGWGRRIARTQKRRLRWAEIVPLHSSLGNNSETPSQKKKKEKEKKIKKIGGKWLLYLDVLKYSTFNANIKYKRLYTTKQIVKKDIG